jgi:hypothetical protein
MVLILLIGASLVAARHAATRRVFLVVSFGAVIDGYADALGSAEQNARVGVAFGVNAIPIAVGIPGEISAGYA